MNRIAVLLSCAFLIAGSGCCCHQQQCNPCGGYGAGFAPTYAPMGGGCPNGACGAYPSGAYVGGATTAASPYGYQTAYIDPIPKL